MEALRLGIMGGTFDPIHYGHLATAEQARDKFGLQKILFVPNREPPHKKGYDVTPAERRYDMVLLATASHPHFEASRLELDRPGPSFTIDTIEQLRREHGEGPDFYFITGADAVLEILTWKDPHRLMDRCQFIAATRPGYSLEELERQAGAEVARRVHLLEVPLMDVSSTMLRERVRRGLSIRYLTPPEVEAYIRKHGLYRAR